MNAVHRREQSLYLKAIHEIERVISELSNRKNFLNKLCREIKEKLGFKYVTIQLINWEEHIIETIEGIGIGENWVGLARHYLEEERSLRDIQADIALSKRTEIISGWDNRFDPWIYNELQKGTISRITTPIILVSDENGNLIENWWEKYYKWEIVSDEITEQQHTILKLVPLKAQSKLIIDVIGTVGAGFPISDKTIPAQDAINLNKFLADKAEEIRKFLLPYVLQTIVEYAIQVVNADSASLHFLYDPYSNDYVYEVCSGNISIPFLKDCRPSDDGLGKQAIETGEPNFFPAPSHHKSDSQKVGINPKKRAIGIKAQAVFPLKVGEKQGVLYIYFHRYHEFTDDEIGLLNFFANRVVAAIQHATTYAQLHNMTNQLSSLHKISLSLVEKTPFGKKLLPFIANSARNLLAADVVVIYEYFESTQEFKVCPEIAGKLIDREAIINENITEQNIPVLLMKRGGNIYSESISQEPIFSTLEQEKIKSVAGILLSVGDTFLGLMLITYRRPHSFSGDEKEIIETLASSAAIAIKNARLYSDVNQRRKVLVEIGQNLTAGIRLREHKVLNLIYEQASQRLGMHNLTIALYDETIDIIRFALGTVDGERIDVEKESGWGPRKRGDGKTEWIIRNKRHLLLPTQERIREMGFSPVPGHKDYEGTLPNSWLGVPMIVEDKVLGVIANYDYGQDHLFNEDDIEILQALADYAAIAIDNARLYYDVNEKLKDVNQTLEKLGQRWKTLVHIGKELTSGIRLQENEILELIYQQAREVLPGQTHLN